LITLSVSNSSKDSGKKDLRFSDTFIRACTNLPSPALPSGWEGSGTDHSRRGIYLAHAYVDGSSLIGQNGESNVSIEIFCFAGANDSSQPGVGFNEDTAWTFDQAEGGYVVMSGSLFDGETALVSLEGELAAGGEFSRLRFSASVVFRQTI